MNEQQQPLQPLLVQPFDPDAPLAELVGRLAKGKGLVELVREARWKRKRPARELPSVPATLAEALKD